MPGDTYYSNVSLLLHFDGANGSTTIPDTSPSPKTVTCVGDAKITTADQKWGTGSGVFDGTGDRMTVPYDSTLHLSTGDFTIECWAKTTSTARYLMAFGEPSLGEAAWQININGSGQVIFQGFITGGGTITAASTTAINGGTWRHVAVTRSGSTFRVFVDGTQVASASSASALMSGANTSTYRLVIGANAANGGVWLGNIDDLRITATVARYTANFTAPTAAFEDSGPPTNAYVDVPGPLGAPAAVGGQSRVFATAAGPLGNSAVFGVQQMVLASAAGPLGAPAVFGVQQMVLVAVPGPLGAPRVVGAQQFAQVVTPGPLGAPAAVGGQSIAQPAVQGPLGAPAAQIFVRPAGQVSVPGPLGAPAAVVWHDFTGQVAPGAVLLYVMDLVTPGGLVRVPISSWQATLQTDASCYVQCVVPAATDWVSALTAATSFVISRRAQLAAGTWFEYEMARSPIDSRSFAGGPTNYTATISGYPSALTANANPPAAQNRTLSGVRSMTTTDGTVRVRADVDWLLRPGMRAIYGATEILVDFINYYVPGNDQYMDVGERA